VDNFDWNRWTTSTGARIQSLAEIDERKSRVIELRYFGGLSVQETSAVLGVSENTVIRDWALAKAWLRRELEAQSGDES
jgi:RNA polymerase sigma factor (sigma-70 family)